MNDALNSLQSASWTSLLAVFIPLLLACIYQFFLGNPFKYVTHTLYLSGTLGSGKTSYAALMAYAKRKGYKVYSTFQLQGSIPFDISKDPWPKGKKVIVILDEMLRLKKNKFYDIGMLSDGLTMARQWDQIVVWLSQSHLSDLGDLDGTFQTFATTHKFPLGRLGHINIMRFSSNKFRRSNKVRATDMKTLIVFVPARIYRTYDSKMIYGYTCDKEGRKFTEEEIAKNRISREAMFKLRRKQAELMADQEARRLVESGEFRRAGAAHELGERSETSAAHEPPRRTHRVSKPRRHEYDW